MTKHTQTILGCLLLALTACGDIPDKQTVDECDEACQAVREAEKRNAYQQADGDVPHLCSGELPACYWRVNPREGFEVECTPVFESTFDEEQFEDLCM